MVEYDPGLRKPAIESVGLVAGIVAAAVSQLALDQQIHLATRATEIESAVAELVTRLTADLPVRSHKRAAASPTAKLSPVRRSGIDELSGQVTTNWAGPVAGPTFLERTFGISRSSLNRWQRRNYVVSLRSGGRKHVFPLAQFVDGRPAAGIVDVLSQFSNQRAAWLWLIRPNSELNGQIPIELLKQDRRDAVIEAARAQND
ncbi:hypothetical protein [Mesorhizobium sp. WSM2239]|uniref:Antitoxin Xre/MbcA/ParS-like toxin-binding domain-containing protein n=2 Tax=unclassified Mesorhizobium TaxID=325217 RepID=A0AAU8DH45_9HYPH